MKQKSLPIVVGICLLVIGMFVGYFVNNTKNNSEQKMHIQDALIKAQVQQAYSMLETVYEGHVDKMYSLAEAKKLGADLLRGLRYGDDNQGYLWADTSEGVNVVLYGQKEVEGKNRYEAEVNGNYYMKQIIQNGKKQGGGFTEYYYPKMNQSDPLPKRSFSLLFEPFDWVLGTGYYLEDLK